jgi:hypothetical protein
MLINLYFCQFLVCVFMWYVVAFNIHMRICTLDMKSVLK